ncbi:MAG: multidrug transporter [Planctomycetaceae bacterium]|nr:multidrug transporter [Planctomycetaceae bacterium]
MHTVIRWATRNSPAMNTLMVGIMVVGLMSMLSLRREVFPEFSLEMILVSVPYPGASPEEVEEGICQKIEEAVQPIAGIRKQTSVANEGVGSVVLELEANVPDVQKILNEVRSEVDRIPSFPELSEDPEVKQVTIRQPAIRIGVVGPESDAPDYERRLRDLTESIRNDLLQLPAVSQANIMGARDYQIDIELSEGTLRQHGLTLQDVARLVRRQNVELPGGRLNTESQVLLLRGKNKQISGEEIAKLPLLTQPNGVVLTVGDLGVVRDEFVDITSITRINGRPGLVISVDRTSTEDLFRIVDQVQGYLDEKQLPAGFEFLTWQDRSIDVRDRMDLLVKNGLQGLLLVFLVLALFLELRLAFWVALGIPVSILGSCAILLMTGQSLNMISMFSFLMALGIVVDDAIVIGENIYEHRQRNKPFLRAAIDGAVEVLHSVAASVMTTVIAFTPLMYVSGIMGKFIAVMPMAVIAILIISLIESTFILPCHLSHEVKLTLVNRTDQFVRQWPRLLRLSIGFLIVRLAMIATLVFMPFQFKPLQWIESLFAAVNGKTTQLTHRLIERAYLPTLSFCLKSPLVPIATAVALFAVSIAFVKAGVIPVVVFPKLDTNTIESNVSFPDGTPSSVTSAATKRIEQTILDLATEYQQDGFNVLSVVHRAVGQTTSQGPSGPDSLKSGSHVGNVSVELRPIDERHIRSDEIIAKWRQRCGEIAGVERLTFGAREMGPGGPPIEFKLLSSGGEFEMLQAAVEEYKAELAQQKGVYDVRDDSAPGKWEFRLKIKDSAESMGIPLADLAETVRASYYGQEVMRLQRGRHEVKLMVRYPQDERKSLAGFHDIRVRTGDGAERPLTELATIDVKRGYSEINRVDQLRSITITADIEEKAANAKEITDALQQRGGFEEKLLAKYPDIRVRWEGQKEQTNESMRSMFIGFFCAVLAMFVLLTIEFRSYMQPLIILFIIPFGFIGAVAGHILMGIPISMFSMFGLVALTGVVVNDSIVLIDFINQQLGEGKSLSEALMTAGARRFRPVMLTSITTIAGLTPILLETSFQAQILIPMATSIIFGLMFATFVVLFLVPAMYLLYGWLMELMFGSVRSEH